MYRKLKGTNYISTQSIKSPIKQPVKQVSPCLQSWNESSKFCSKFCCRTWRKVTEAFNSTIFRSRGATSDNTNDKISSSPPKSKINSPRQQSLKTLTRPTSKSGYVEGSFTLCRLFNQILAMFQNKKTSAVRTSEKLQPSRKKERIEANKVTYYDTDENTLNQSGSMSISMATTTSSLSSNPFAAVHQNLGKHVNEEGVQLKKIKVIKSRASNSTFVRTVRNMMNHEMKEEDAMALSGQESINITTAPKDQTFRQKGLMWTTGDDEFVEGGLDV